MLAAIALARGDVALAEDLARLCLEGADPSDPACAPLLELLVDIQLARGDLDARAARRSTGSPSSPRRCRVTIAARLRRARGGTSASGRRRRASLRRISMRRWSASRPSTCRSRPARARLELARALGPSAPDAAVAEARLALATFERLGASRDADARGRPAAQTSAPPGRAWPKRYGALTKRETEVLSLLAAGCSNAEIGERLFISRRTAEHHVASILSKLGLRSRAEAAAYAVRERSEGPVAK